jgi:hypothetical protein
LATVRPTSTGSAALNHRPSRRIYGRRGADETDLDELGISQLENLV